jgi:hypothetical protein
MDSIAAHDFLDGAGLASPSKRHVEVVVRHYGDRGWYLSDFSYHRAT